MVIMLVCISAIVTAGFAYYLYRKSEKEKYDMTQTKREASSRGYSTDAFGVIICHIVFFFIVKANFKPLIFLHIYTLRHFQ